MSSSPAAATAPRFQGNMGVTQVPSFGFIDIVLYFVLPMGLPPLVCGIPMFYLVSRSEEPVGFIGVLAMIGSIVLLMIGILAGFFLFTWLDLRDTKKERNHAVSSTPQITVDANGLRIDGLGLVDWDDVLTLEGIPDSDTYLIVHTQNLGKLMLSSAPVNELAPVLSYYLEHHAESHRLALSDSRSADTVRFKAQEFHYPRFVVWIGLGYVLGVAAGIATVFAGLDELPGILLVAVFVAAMVAWLVWFFPIKQLTILSPGRMRGFELQGNQLRSTDGRWLFDIAAADIYRHETDGVGYELDFISIRSPEGERLDLIVSDEDRRALIKRWSLER